MSSGPTKRLEIFDENEPKMLQLEKISDVYKHSDRIRAALKKSWNNASFALRRIQKGDSGFS